MKHLFGFRNGIAHGKSKLVKRSKGLPHRKFSDIRLGEQLRTDWEIYCTKKNAQKARKDVEEIFNELHKRRNSVLTIRFLWAFNIIVRLIVMNEHFERIRDLRVANKKSIVYSRSIPGRSLRCHVKHM